MILACLDTVAFVKRRRKAVIAACILLALFFLSPVLFRKYRVPLVSHGSVVVVATRPFVLPWSDNEFSVYVGESKAFSLWGDSFDCPLLIYPFADGKRFLCIDDDDTSVLVFMVDLNRSATNAAQLPLWPPNDYLRNYMAYRMTHVVTETRGIVRLPTYSEVQETSRNLASLTEGEIDNISFPFVDLGIYRSYASKERLLSELDPHRQSAWP